MTMVRALTDIMRYFLLSLPFPRYSEDSRYSGMHVSVFGYIYIPIW